jgi:uncharacterized protein (DUF58 family)
VRLSAAGWATLVGVAAMAVAGRLLGLTEWYVAAGAVGLVVLLSGVWLGTRPSRLQVDRTISPPRIPAGGVCQVQLRVSSPSRRRSAVTALDDLVDGRRRIRLLLGPVSAGEPVLTRHRLPAGRRGLLRVGPITLVTNDPFGIWERRQDTGSQVEVVVLPAIVPLVPLPESRGEEPEAGRRDVRALQATTDEVSTLREFRPGDDVRRVHWPTTARVGEPVVRQFDEPSQRRVTVLLDTAAVRTGADPFERAVSVAASILVTSTSAGQAVRLVTPDGVDTGFIDATSGIEPTMDLLATIQTAGPARLDGARAAIAARPGGGTLVSVWGRLAPDVDAEAALIEARFGAAVRVVCDPDQRVGGTWPIVHHDGTRDLAADWATAVAAIARSRDLRRLSPAVGGGGVE